MPRTVSTTFHGAVNAQETSEVFLVLLKINHADMATPLYFVDNIKDVTSTGQVYSAYPFKWALPDSDPERAPEVRITIDNVAQDIIAQMRSVSSPLEITLSVILASAPDTVEIGPLVLEMMSADWDAMTISSRLSYPELLDEPFPAHTFTPKDFPGLFAGVS